MRQSTIYPPRRFRVIVAGGIDASRNALAEHVSPHRPLGEVAVDGYGAVHATVYADEAELAAWFASCHDTSVPGTLLFYR
jgi:hypothetical protein